MSNDKDRVSEQSERTTRTERGFGAPARERVGGPRGEAPGSNESRRIAAVQPPIIPTVQRWVRATPGTISLGQGIVAYGPPAEALEAARRFGGTSTDHMYGPVEGLAEFADALEQKL